MKPELPKYLLFTATSPHESGGLEWRFLLIQQGVEGSITASSVESGLTGSRAELLALVRGLEAIDQPGHVQHFTASGYLSRGVRPRFSSVAATELALGALRSPRACTRQRPLATCRSCPWFSHPPMLSLGRCRVELRVGRLHRARYRNSERRSSYFDRCRRASGYGYPQTAQPRSTEFYKTSETSRRAATPKGSCNARTRVGTSRVKCRSRYEVNPLRKERS